MPSKKIFAIIVVCSSLVFSVWIINKTPPAKASEKRIASVNNYSVENRSSDDWKKTIESFNTAPQAYSNLTKSSNSLVDETSITSQISIDLMSKYLIAKQDGTVTEDEMKEITDSIVNSKAYLRPQTSVYTPSNLNIAIKDDKDALEKYRANLNLAVKNGLGEIKIDPMFVLYTALKSNNENELTKLDPVIKANKEAIIKFLEIPVPRKIATLHLNLLNSLGHTLDDFQGMRNMFNDPVTGLQAANNYGTNVKEFIDNLTKLNSYLSSQLEKQ